MSRRIKSSTLLALLGVCFVLGALTHPRKINQAQDSRYLFVSRIFTETNTVGPYVTGDPENPTFPIAIVHAEQDVITTNYVVSFMDQGIVRTLYVHQSYSSLK